MMIIVIVHLLVNFSAFGDEKFFQMKWIFFRGILMIDVNRLNFSNVSGDTSESIAGLGLKRHLVTFAFWKWNRDDAVFASNS